MITNDRPDYQTSLDAAYVTWLGNSLHPLDDKIGSVTLLDYMGSDLTVANSARVSMDKWKDTYDGSDRRGSDKRLIKYLASSKPVTHFTPFTHVQVQFRITVPIFVARQWTKSNVGTSRNEVSRRYVDTPPSFYLPRRHEWRRRPGAAIKQGSGGPMYLTVLEYWAVQLYVRLAVRLYNRLLRKDVAPELARIVLPQNMYTTWIETGSLYYWANFVRQRIDGNAQYEIRQYAGALDRILSGMFPDSWAALEDRK